MRIQSNRDLTIRKQRRQWKRRWKIDFASFFALITSRPVNWKHGTCVKLELKRGDRVRVQRGIVNKFFALSFQFLSPSTKKKLNIPRCSCVRTAEKCTKKKWCTCRQSCRFAHSSILCFRRSPCRRRRSFVRSIHMSDALETAIPRYRRNF